MFWKTGSDREKIHDKNVSFVGEESSKQRELFTRFKKNILLADSL